jgi:succinate-acetate transporter protein
MTDHLSQDLEKGINSNSSAEYIDPQTLTGDSPSQNPILKVMTSTNGDVVYLGNQAFNKKDLMNAFAGDLQPGIHPSPHRPMGNPVPLGLTSFCICCFVVSMVNVQARGVTNVKIIAACALFFAGVVESVAGLWCLVIENTFAATALGSFGGFWMGYAGILIDAFGIASSYTTTEEFNNALGIYLIAWMIFAFLMWLCTFKATWPFFFLFLFIWLFILCLAVGAFSGNANATKAGGGLGLVATFIGFFIVYAGTATHENSYITIPATPMPGAPRI